MNFKRIQIERSEPWMLIHRVTLSTLGLREGRKHLKSQGFKARQLYPDFYENNRYEIYYNHVLQGWVRSEK